MDADFWAFEAGISGTRCWQDGFGVDRQGGEQPAPNSIEPESGEQILGCWKGRGVEVRLLAGLVPEIMKLPIRDATWIFLQL